MSDEQTARAIVVEWQAMFVNPSFMGQVVVPEKSWLVERIAAALAAERERCLEAVNNEPELPGDIPEDILATIQALDAKGMEEWCRILVRATKRNIAAAIRKEGA